jgi:hypothetical protein
MPHGPHPFLPSGSPEAIDSPPRLGCSDCLRMPQDSGQEEQATMIELSLWVLGAVLALGLVACRLARKPKKEHDLELLDFDFDKIKTYEKDGRKYPFSY